MLYACTLALTVIVNGQAVTYPTSTTSTPICCPAGSVPVVKPAPASGTCDQNNPRGAYTS